MMLKYLVLGLLLFGVSADVRAELPPELQGFEFLEDALPKDEFGSTNRKKEGNSKRSMQKDIIPQIVERIPELASFNIQNAEQVFCYHIEKRTKDYKGYTIGNYKIVDYCGELDFGTQTTTYEALFTRSPNIITTIANCKIAPKVMLRFVRGVDAVDVLLSSPCPSFTVFYGGKYKSFNIKQGIIDDVISQFDKKREEFMSPSLIKQTVANAKVETAEDSYEIEKNKKELEEFDKEEVVEEKPEKKKGWGNLKLKM